MWWGLRSVQLSPGEEAYEWKCLSPSKCHLLCLQVIYGTLQSILNLASTVALGLVTDFTGPKRGKLEKLQVFLLLPRKTTSASGYLPPLPLPNLLPKSGIRKSSFSSLSLNSTCLQVPARRCCLYLVLFPPSLLPRSLQQLLSSLLLHPVWALPGHPFCCNQSDLFKDECDHITYQLKHFSIPPVPSK